MESVNHGLGLKQKTGVIVINGSTINPHVASFLASSYNLKAIIHATKGSGSSEVQLSHELTDVDGAEDGNSGFSHTLAAILQAASTQPSSADNTAGFSHDLSGILIIAPAATHPESASQTLSLSQTDDGSTLGGNHSPNVQEILEMGDTADPEFQPTGLAGFSHSVGVEVTGDRPLGDKIKFGHFIGGYLRAGRNYLPITGTYANPSVSLTKELRLKNLNTLDEVILKSPELGNSREYDYAILDRRGLYNQVNKTSRSPLRPVLLSQTFEIYLKLDSVEQFIAFEKNNRGLTLQLTDHLGQVWTGMLRLKPITELKNWTTVIFEFLGKAVVT